MAKGKNRTGPRNKGPRPHFSDAAAPSQGNPEKRGSAVTARAAVDQLLALGFSIQCHPGKQSHMSADQKKAIAWVQGTTGVQFARVTQSGYSFYMTSPQGTEITMPAGKTLSFDALRNIETLTGVRLVPNPTVTRDRAKFVFV